MQKKCEWCGNFFTPLRKSSRYCHMDCIQAAYTANHRHYEKSDRGRIVRYKPKKRDALETDAEQQKIRDELNRKWSIPPGTVTHYRPGTPEFDEIAKQITPLNLVRSGKKPIDITAPMVGGYLRTGRKREDEL